MIFSIYNEIVLCMQPGVTRATQMASDRLRVKPVGSFVKFWTPT